MKPADNWSVIKELINSGRCSEQTVITKFPICPEHNNKTKNTAITIKRINCLLPEITRERESLQKKR